MPELDPSAFAETKVVKLDDGYVTPVGWVVLETFVNDFLMATFEEVFDPNNHYGSGRMRQSGGEVVSQTYALIGRHANAALEARGVEVLELHERCTRLEEHIQRLTDASTIREANLAAVEERATRAEEANVRWANDVNHYRVAEITREGLLAKLKAALGDIRVAEILGDGPKFGGVS